MWEGISESQFVSSCLSRFDDCLNQETSSSPEFIQRKKLDLNKINTKSNGLNLNWNNHSVLNTNCETISNTRKGYLKNNSSKRTDFQYNVVRTNNFNGSKQKLHNNYKQFLNMDRVMPWTSNVESFQQSYFDRNRCNLKNDNDNNMNNNYFYNLNNNHYRNKFRNNSNKIFCEGRNTICSNIGSGNINTSPVKSDISTSTSLTSNSSLNEKSIKLDGSNDILSDKLIEYNNYEHIPPLEFGLFSDDKTDENYYYQVNNLFSILSPSWILCIDIAAVLLTNTDNKMALSNIGPKLSFLSRDALRQIKQKKLSRFIKEHSSFFDIRRPSPDHSALYVTLKFPLPSIMQQFLPKIAELRKYESEQNQYNIFQSSGYYIKNNDINSYSLQNELEQAFCDNSCLNKKKLINEYDCSNLSNEFIVVKNSNKPSFKITQVYEEIPTVVRSFQIFECWLCVREFANVLIHQPTHTMELREIGVLMSQKARIQAKRNSSKKNYKSFLLCYPKLFRIFGKDDNHSIQWIGSHQDFIKLGSIKFQPPQTDDELFNIPTLNESHSQFLFNLNNCSVSLK
ncbi:hypothetical protein FG386_002651 [Cryptosporidium ryanae]|uniref:uncharacterized protein n=1 Tax=Cryptosporidium ryanae TaxID=515981 RepID=UPI00351A5E46|nr:hypothetical protein FG386_002651 [Cryptosporidium ryanae]